VAVFGRCTPILGRRGWGRGRSGRRRHDRGRRGPAILTGGRGSRCCQAPGRFPGAGGRGRPVGGRGGRALAPGGATTPAPESAAGAPRAGDEGGRPLGGWPRAGEGEGSASDRRPEKHGREGRRAGCGRGRGESRGQKPQSALLVPTSAKRCSFTSLISCMFGEEGAASRASCTRDARTRALSRRTLPHHNHAPRRCALLLGGRLVIGFARRRRSCPPPATSSCPPTLPSPLPRFPGDNSGRGRRRRQPPPPPPLPRRLAPAGGGRAWDGVAGGGDGPCAPSPSHPSHPTTPSSTLAGPPHRGSHGLGPARPVGRPG